MMTTLSTYLLLNGTCEDAMRFYQSCFGGELQMTKLGDSPMKAYMPVSLHGKIVNAKLQSEGINISASDWLMPNQTPIQGNTVCMYLSGGTPKSLKNLFDKLSADANITDPLTEQPFGLYGALNDKFGIRWMFTCEIPIV
jgi:PhnB protein